MIYLLLFFRTLKKSFFGFFNNDGFLAAKALSFQTLFCLLPSFLLLLFLTSKLEVFHIPLFKIEEFITTSFLPAPLKNDLVTHITTASNHTQSVITIVLFIFLFATFSLVTDIHDAFYHLSYKTKRVKKSIIFHIGTYIFIIIGSCSLLIIDFVLGAIFIKNIEISEIPNYLLKIISFLVTSFILYCIYQVMSPVKIYKIHTAIISIIVSLFLSLGQGLFLLYLNWFPGYMLVYGAIATLPILFFWVYLHWIILLSGYTLLVELASLKRAKEKDRIKQNEISSEHL